MKELAPRIHDTRNGLDYVLVGDYYIPELALTPKKDRPIDRWGRLHREYLKQFKTARYNELVLSDTLHEYLSDLNEQATDRLSLIIDQMKEAEGVTESLKEDNQMEWVRHMNSIKSRAEEIIKAEMIYC